MFSFCCNNEQQVGWQFPLNQVHRFHYRQIHFYWEWLLLTITLIDNSFSTDELWYTKSKLLIWVVLQPSPPSTLVVYGHVWLCDNTNSKLTKCFLQLIIEDIISSYSVIMLRFINTRSFVYKSVIIQHFVCYVMLHAAYKIIFIITQHSVKAF